MFEGTASLEHTRHERGAWIARLKKYGKLDSALASEASIGRRSLFYLFGYLAVAAGLFLLIGGLVTAPYITW